ncbi:MAG: hypothetical protein HYY16_17150 [Planctomycetes bacterium]|nr:hypothetical protein [Planctomycetota bacterium]
MPLVLALILAQTDPAEIFRKVCAGLEEAASVRADVTAEIRQGEASATAAGSVRLKGETARLDLSVSRGDARKVVKLFFQNARCTEMEDGQTLAPEDVHRDTPRRIKAALARVGLIGLSFLACQSHYEKKTRNDLPDLASLKCSAFTLEREEALADRKTWVVSFRAEWSGSNLEPISITMWIDQERYVPLKRRLAAKSPDQDVTITETASLYEVNGEIPHDELRQPEK